MSIATLTSKGQITLPRELRRKLHLEAGEKIDFRIDEAAGTATLVPLNRKVEEVFGVLQRSSLRKHVSTEEMDEAVKAKFRRDFS